MTGSTTNHQRRARSSVHEVAARITSLFCLVVSAVAATLAAMSLNSGRPDRGHLLAWIAVAALATGAFIRWRWRRAADHESRR
ncbi:hypothetical protein OHA21_15265 [Actinoplanes sp. NBC_00393]|uniref:hypothetical protein n=1 Tax=Actinoplanes sp. NBC_00393 TaxID=2975953 RepID=UPI002E22630E